MKGIIGLCLEVLSIAAVVVGGYSFLFDNDFETGIFALLLAIWIKGGGFKVNK